MTAYVELIPNPNVKSERTLHLRLQAGNGQAECSGQVVDDVLEGIKARDWGEELWASRGLDLRLPVSNLDIGDAVLLEELEDVVGRVVGDLAGESIRHHADPDRSRSDVDCPT